MADDLTRPYIGYRSAGRRPESQQNRRAAADAPLSALRGAVSGVLGAPGDIESLIRMLPGLSEQTVLPTSEDIEKRLPFRELNQTPTGKAFTTAGQLGGGFYTGPGSPLRAIAALPSAVGRAGRDFAMAAGQPAVNVVKPKGGNWLAGSVEHAVKPMQVRERTPGVNMHTEEDALRDQGINRWLETKLTKYMKNEMATPEDPIRALAERGVLHADVQPTGYNVTRARNAAGFPEEGMATSPMAKNWEDRADTFINEIKASDITSGYPESVEANPWLLKVPPETRVYDMLRGADEDLGFAHLTDELRNAINPASGLPENLLWKYQDLDKVTVPQAVERVAKINDWRAAQKAEADMARSMNPATQVVKEYPDQGFKWVELRAPDVDVKALGYTTEKVGDLYHAVDPQGNVVLNTRSSSADEALKRAKPAPKELEDALKYEGETMGHCVGGYCPDVVEGRSKIYSLRDKKGQPHVTIEVKPRNITAEEAIKMAISEGLPEKGMETFNRVAEIMGSGDFMRQDIVQIKGKANRAPKEDYLPAVQDFVRSGNFGRVGDLKNSGLVDLDQVGVPAEMRGGQRFVTEDEYKDIVRKNAQGFSRGGAVRSLHDLHARYAEGGAVTGAISPTDDFDPARIDAIVASLNAEFQA